MAFICFILFMGPEHGFGKIFIDINAPSIQRIQIAIPDFKNRTTGGDHSKLSSALPKVISNDLELSGYFRAIDKEAFLENGHNSLDSGGIIFKNWSVIGAELLFIGRYTTIGRSLELEVRLFDVFSGKQIMGKRFLGKINEYRSLMHRVGNEIIRMLTGHKGIFLTRLTYVDNATGYKEIYVSDIDGYNGQQMTFDQGISLLPKWSPSGEKLIFVSYRDGGPMVYMKDMASGTDRRISSRSGLNIGASWAPDGRRLALTLSHEGNPNIYIIDLNGKIIRRVTKHWGIDVSPCFSPDGKKIAFVSNRSGSPQIYIHDLATGKDVRLTYEGKYNSTPSWSPLNRIAFSGMNNGRLDIYTINPDGRRLRKLTENQRNNEDPSWSPDGRYIVFSSNRDGRYHLYIMNGAGQNQEKITSGKGQQTSPSWSPF